MPEGAGRVNEAGIAFYNDLIDELLKMILNHILPCITGNFHMNCINAVDG